VARNRSEKPAAVVNEDVAGREAAESGAAIVGAEARVELEGNRAASDARSERVAMIDQLAPPMI